jgi:hypothetical protein
VHGGAQAINQDYGTRWRVITSMRQTFTTCNVELTVRSARPTLTAFGSCSARKLTSE